MPRGQLQCDTIARTGSCSGRPCLQYIIKPRAQSYRYYLLSSRNRKMCGRSRKYKENHIYLKRMSYTIDEVHRTQPDVSTSVQGGAGEYATGRALETTHRRVSEWQGREGGQTSTISHATRASNVCSKEGGSSSWWPLRSCTRTRSAMPAFVYLCSVIAPCSRESVTV